MSRSYRKNPFYKDRYGSKALKFYKRLSNKKIRNCDDTYNHKEFKKIMNSWEIHDYVSYWTESDFRKEWFREEDLPQNKQFYHNEFKTLEKALFWFRKTYLNK